MDKHKHYIVSLASLFFLTVVVLSALREPRLELYVSLFTVGYFAISAVFRPRRRWLDMMGIILFTVFCLIVAFKVAEILLG